MVKLYTNIKKINSVQVKNFLALALNRGGTLVLQVVLVPVAIYLLGKDKYGEWLMLSAIPSYLMISDFGINITVTTSICTLIAKGDYSQAMALYKSANTFVMLIGGIVLSLFTFSSIFIEWNHFLSLKLIDEFNTEVTLSLLIISTFISFVIGLLLGIYRAEGKFYLTESLAAIYYLLDSIVFIIIIYLGNSFIQVGLAQITWRVLFIIIISFKISKSYEWFSIRFTKNIQPIISLLPTSIYYMAYIVGYGLILQGTILLVGKNLGTSSLVTFNTTRTLANSIKSFISVFYFSFLPEYTVLIAQNKIEHAKRIFKKMFIITLYISISAVVIYYFAGEQIMNYWTKGKVHIEQPFYSLMLLTVFFSTLGNCAYTVLNATNENRTIGIYYSILAFSAMIALHFWVEKGLIYVACILLIVEVVLFLISFIVAQKKLSVGINKY